MRAAIAPCQRFIALYTAEVYHRPTNYLLEIERLRALHARAVRVGRWLGTAVTGEVTTSRTDSLTRSASHVRHSPVTSAHTSHHAHNYALKVVIKRSHQCVAGVLRGNKMSNGRYQPEEEIGLIEGDRSSGPPELFTYCTKANNGSCYSTSICGEYGVSTVEPAHLCAAAELDRTSTWLSYRQLLLISLKKNQYIVLKVSFIILQEYVRNKSQLTDYDQPLAKITD
ncbi:hypothetical protein EVAR_93906_1 [Eumeta japonica]|uniref:Uncharacterized protein n=1 Tax=Eumeta variegata TaxID=151549 RepID=A0A4C1TP10_EUMVA|nr:hypothetical protein EVAR_93906_1 [Eumeta japonica]